MKKWILIVALLPLVASAQETAPQDNIARHIQIKDVNVYAKRPIKEIGTQQTKFDTVVLKENIALSMADVLTFNSSIFVKNYGRATLSTVAFRGTSPSHTQVSWNGMKLNNPMLGMTDFSTIPSYFIDDASLLHGTSSVGETGGGLGGAVKLSTQPANADGFGAQYIQGIGSFKSFDEFLRLTYGNDHWQISTRAVYSSSPNDYKYLNHDKKENIQHKERHGNRNRALRGILNNRSKTCNSSADHSVRRQEHRPSERIHRKAEGNKEILLYKGSYRSLI